MEFKDYYKVMGVARDATEAQIKQAYRKLARKYHPDVSKEKDAEARFKEVGEAYEVLKSPEKRAAYDQLGQGPRPGEDFRPPPDWGAGFEFSGAGDRESDYSDFFETLFGARAGTGNRRGAFHPGRGEDHHAKVLLDLDATLHGGARQITLRVPEIDADGRLVSKERVLNVQVPKGILAGQHIRLAGQGARPPVRLALRGALKLPDHFRRALSHLVEAQPRPTQLGWRRIERRIQVLLKPRELRGSGSAGDIHQDP